MYASIDGDGECYGSMGPTTKCPHCTSWASCIWVPLLHPLKWRTRVAPGQLIAHIPCKYYTTTSSAAGLFV